MTIIEHFRGGGGHGGRSGGGGGRHGGGGWGGGGGHGGRGHGGGGRFGYGGGGGGGWGPYPWYGPNVIYYNNGGYDSDNCYIDEDGDVMCLPY